MKYNNNACQPCETVSITPEFIKKWYEINYNTNPFTDADKTKLDSLTNQPGVDGKDGVDGVDGQPGKDGKNGVDGIQGITGNEGPRGLNGQDGKDGANQPVPGPAGPKGDTGAKGDRGINGADGKNGKDGLDGVGLKGDKGTTGDRGAQGLVGSTGNTGFAGPRGPKGLDGKDGSMGATGSQGPRGDAGKDGTGVVIKGSDTEANILKKSGKAGDMWLITDKGPKEGHGLVSNGMGSGITNWTNVGSIAGPKGDRGEKGDPGKDGINGADSIVPGPAGQDGQDGLRGHTGGTGPASTVPGPKGNDGIGYRVLGSKPLADIVAINGKEGDIWVSTTGVTVGHGYVSDGKGTGTTNWADVGMLRGVPGVAGPIGPQGPKGDPGSGGTGGGLSPADQAKLDLIQVDPTTHDMTVDSDVLSIGSGAKDVAIKLHNPVDKDATYQGDGAKGTWYIGSFPNSTIHPDDLVLSNSGGGLFTSIADGAKWSVRYGSDIVSFTKAELQAVKAGSGGAGTPGPKGDKGDPGKDGVDGKDSVVPGPAGTKGADGTPGVKGADGKDGILDPVEKAKLAHITVTKDVDLDAMQVNLANGLAAFAGSTFTNPGLLTDGKNLDDFKTEGYFENRDKAKAGTIALHYPEDGSLGILKVFADANLSNKVYQEFMDINDARFYTRAFDGTSWHQWVLRDLDALKPSDVASVTDLDAANPTPEQQGKLINLYGANHLIAKVPVLTPVDQGKLGHIQVTKGINLDECILEGDRASQSDLLAHAPSADVLKRFVDNAGLRSIISAMSLERPTVVSPYTDAKPTKPEMIAAIKLLSHFSDNATFWGGEHDFYVKDNPQTKMLLVKYRGIAANTNTATAGDFFVEKMTLAK